MKKTPWMRSLKHFSPEKTDNEERILRLPTQKTVIRTAGTVFLLLLFLIYPLYMKSGYTDICSDKYIFFSRLSSAAVLALILTGAVPFLGSMVSVKLSRTDIFVLLFLFETALSFLFSIDKKTALTGTDGWYMGAFTLGILGVLYFLISRLWTFSDIILYAALFASAAVDLLGILDRFSLYLIPLSARHPSFISTLGNINWFMGCYSVLTPVGAGLLISELTGLKHSVEPRRFGKLRLILLIVYNVIASAAGFAQGSDSVLLFFGALFAGLLLFFAGDTREGRTLSGAVRILPVFLMFFGSGGVIIRVMRLLLPGYNYDTTGILASVTGGNLTLYVLLAGAILFVLTSGKRGTWGPFRRRLFLPVLCTAIFIWLFAAILHTFGGLFPRLPDDLFLLDPHFGSGRGEAFRAAVLTWSQLPIINRLFGAGPDCFITAAYSVPKLAEELSAYWPEDLLTNAHCEPLTVLVDQGIAGLICFYGMLVSFLMTDRENPVSSTEPAKEGLNEDVLNAIRLAVFCYMIHNLVSFATILNLPFLMMLMAMGRALRANEGAGR